MRNCFMIIGVSRWIIETPLVRGPHLMLVMSRLCLACLGT